MIQNRQRRVRIPLKALNTFLAHACKALRVPPEAVTICLVTNREIARWNRTYRGKNRPTDVLSFPVESEEGGSRQAKAKRLPERRPLRSQKQQPGEDSRERDAKHLRGDWLPDRQAQRTALLQRQMRNRGIADGQDPLDYLGDIAIAPEVARHNAKEFRRTFGEEMRILILHGILHLMGYDHETDSGQMERRERRLRQALKIG